MKRSVGFGLLAAVLNIASGSVMAANEMLVIPDIAAAYLYDGAGSSRDVGSLANLALIKEGSFKEYLIESDPPGLTCDERCHEIAQNLPEGKVTLRIIGKKPISFLHIPLTGKWDGECEQGEEASADESARCVVHLSDMTGPIKVEVNPNVEVGTIMPLPDRGQAMIVKVNTEEGYVLVAGHQLLGSGRPLLIFNPASPLAHANVGSNDRRDGRANMPKLLRHGSDAAEYCAELDGDWYLPASDELALMTPGALSKISGLDMEGSADTGYTWSSTQYGKGLTSANPEKRVTFAAYALFNRDATLSSDRDTYRCDKKESGYECANLRRYQVLCFRRLSI